MYHSLDLSGSVISVAPEQFRAQMGLLKASGAPVVPLAEVRQTPGAFAITFDDGFRNFAETAVPILQSNGFPATVFVVSGFCGRLNDWPPQPQQGIPCRRLMSWSEVRDLATQGIEIGAHTVNHPDLVRLPPLEAAAELRDSQARLSDQLGRTVDSLSYPYGRSNVPLRRMARNYFRLACGTTLACATPESDPFDLPRIDAYYLRRPAAFERLLSGSRGYIACRRILRAVRRVLAC